MSYNACRSVVFPLASPPCFFPFPPSPAPSPSRPLSSLSLSLLALRGRPQVCLACPSLSSLFVISPSPNFFSSVSVCHSSPCPRSPPPLSPPPVFPLLSLVDTPSAPPREPIRGTLHALSPGRLGGCEIVGCIDCLDFSTKNRILNKNGLKRDRHVSCSFAGVSSSSIFNFCCRLNSCNLSCCSAGIECVDPMADNENVFDCHDIFTCVFASCSCEHLSLCNDLLSRLVNSDVDVSYCFADCNVSHCLADCDLHSCDFLHCFVDEDVLISTFDVLIGSYDNVDVNERGCGRIETARQSLDLTISSKHFCSLTVKLAQLLVMTSFALTQLMMSQCPKRLVMARC